MKIQAVVRKLFSIPAIFLFMFGLMSLMSGCDRTRNDKGYEYFPDMAHSLAYETYTPNPNFPDGLTQQSPQPGTVNRTHPPYPYANTDEGRALAGSELKNPLGSDSLVLSQGKQLYTVFCMHCHGDKGDGMGYLYTSKRYPMKPASFQSERVLGLPEGELYHVITLGYNTMGAHGAQILPDERWKIIRFIQQVLQNKPL